MLKKKISTVEELDSYLRENLSQKRYNHVVAVAKTCEMVLEHYNCNNYVKTWNGISAGLFCGLAHDIARELDEKQWFEICDKNNVAYDEDEKSFPVLLHGYVSAIMINEMTEGLPQSWVRAIELHTLGDSEMDDLALALFIADYIEPNRTYLTDDQRKEFLSCPTIQRCAYAILCNIIKHLQSKGVPISRKNKLMKEFLESK